MGHYIQGLVFHRTLLVAARTMMPGCRISTLAQGFHLVPITDGLYDDLRRRYSHLVDAENEFERLSAPVEYVAKSMARDGTVAYVETEYFGGTGGQGASVWRSGEVVLQASSPKAGPINDALRLLGVDRLGYHDEFDAVGLGRHRSNEDWVDSVDETEGAG